MGVVVSTTCDFPITRGRTQRACGEEVPGNEPTSITLNGVVYRVLLCAHHHDDLNKALAPFLSVAKQGGLPKVIKRATYVTRNGTPYTTAEVRAWAASKGRPVHPGGRLPDSLIEEYSIAHSGKS